MRRVLKSSKINAFYLHIRLDFSGVWSDVHTRHDNAPTHRKQRTKTMATQLQDTLATMTFGIELEFVCITRQQAARAIHAVVGGTLSGRRFSDVEAEDGRLWRAVDDSSLQSPDGRSAEIVSPILTIDDIPMLQEIVRSLRRAGARANETCGIHVHLGVQSFTPKAICNPAKIVHKHDAHIPQALTIDPYPRQRHRKHINP